MGWVCAQCTYLNKPTRPGCEMCGGDPPMDYKIPDIYQPDQDEILRIEAENLSILMYQQVAVLLLNIRQFW